VTNATVEKSSGSSRLDQAAITWVIQNWRYEPATKNGIPVATTTEAAVKFDLRNAMR
jgi:protein TonB